MGMKIIDIGLNNVPQNDEEIALCLGYFDGVHLGHQKIIKSAKESGLKVAILTFDNSPAYVLGKKNIFELTSLADKAEVFENLGVDILYLMHFDKSSLNITKDEFIKCVLSLIAPKKIYCGADYSFGTRSEGNPEYLSRFFETHIIDLIEYENEKISSRKIRDLVADGDVVEAAKMLGRPYRLTGLVVDGNHVGHTIDFPTANLDLDYDYVVPKVGVYYGYAYCLDEKFKAMISISTHPTIYESPDIVVEVHILDFKEDIYGKTVSVDFLNYIRDIKHFYSLDELKDQLEKDRNFVKKTLK